MTTTDQPTPADHYAAQQYAAGVLKRGSAYGNPLKNLARCFLRTCDEAVTEACGKLNDAEEIERLRAEVALYRSIVNDLSCVITQLTYSEHNAP